MRNHHDLSVNKDTIEQSVGLGPLGSPKGKILEDPKRNDFTLNISALLLNSIDLDTIHNDFLYFCLQESPNQLLEEGHGYDEIFSILSHEYRRRWGIETGYRVFKQIWGKTTSQSYSLRYWLMWNAVMVYNLWVMENLELIENGNKLTVNYSCCETASLQEIDEEEKLREGKKYPTWSRVSSEMPSRKWKPHPVEPTSSSNIFL